MLANSHARRRKDDDGKIIYSWKLLDDECAKADMDDFDQYVETMILDAEHVEFIIFNTN